MKAAISTLIIDRRLFILSRYNMIVRTLSALSLEQKREQIQTARKSDFEMTGVRTPAGPMFV